MLVSCSIRGGVPSFILQAQFGLLDHLAGEVIRVFEDSCGDEWLGQTIECCVESGDGAYRYREGVVWS